MKLKVKKEILLGGIEIIQNVISTKTTLPILSNILLEAQKDTLKLTATDLNIGISCVIPVNTIEPGSVTIPARRFGNIVKELPEDAMEISTKKNNTVIIETELCQFKILGLPPEEFPKLPEFKDREVIKIDQVVLKQMLQMTAFAVSYDETRYILNGILVKFTQNSIALVATDGKRLAVVEKKLKQAANKELHIIIPIKTIQELMRNLQDDGEVSFIVGANQVLFDFGKVLIISRLIEGEFPDYQQVIPPVSESRIKVNREQFLLAVKRASLLVTPDYQAVKFEVFKDKLVVSKSTPDIGESREEVKVEYTGKETVIGFNPNYITDVLKNLDKEQVEFELSGSEKPGVFRIDGYIYIVLPMRLG
jgi:DNA polymerase-3 subunit beta